MLPTSAVSDKPDALPSHIAQTAESLAAMHTRTLAQLSGHQRTIEWLTSRLGRPSSLYAILSLVLTWVALNVALVALGRRAIDAPPFACLQGAASVAALLMTAMVLTSQTRQTRHSDQRAQLDLQVGLLIDAKVTKLISLVEELRRDLPSVPNRRDTLAEEMKEQVAPGVMLEALQQSLEEGGRGGQK